MAAMARGNLGTTLHLARSLPNAFHDLGDRLPARPAASNHDERIVVDDNLQV
jgi:hypothetical protein